MFVSLHGLNLARDACRGGEARGEAQRARVGLALRSCGGIRRTIEKMEVYCSRVVVEGGRGEDTYLTFIIVDIMVDGGGGVLRQQDNTSLAIFHDF